jgi:hypothetical protein
VLVGTNDGALIWADLHKVSQDNRTKIHIYYSDYGSDEDEGRTPLHMSDFAPWSRFLVDGKAPFGIEAWEERVKIVVKIVMLEAGYIHGTVSGIPSALLASIRANIDK